MLRAKLVSAVFAASALLSLASTAPQAAAWPPDGHGPTIDCNFTTEGCNGSGGTGAGGVGGSSGGGGGGGVGRYGVGRCAPVTCTDCPRRGRIGTFTCCDKCHECHTNGCD